MLGAENDEKHSQKHDQSLRISLKKQCFLELVFQNTARSVLT